MAWVVVLTPPPLKRVAAAATFNGLVVMAWVVVLTSPPKIAVATAKRIYFIFNERVVSLCVLLTYSMDFDVLVANAMRSCLFCCEYDTYINFYVHCIIDCKIVNFA